MAGALAPLAPSPVLCYGRYEVDQYLPTIDSIDGHGAVMAFEFQAVWKGKIFHLLFGGSHMSAVSSPYGFINVKDPTGLDRASRYGIASGYAANIFTGDPVKLLTTGGNIQLATSDGTRTGTVDGIKIQGIFVGCQYTDSNGKPNFSPYWPSGTVSSDAVAWVVDAPTAVFSVQASGSLTADSIGDQADWTGFTAPGGSTLIGFSLAQLSSSLVGAGQQGQFRIIDIDGSTDNAWGDAFTKVLVQIAEHTYVAPIVAV